MCEDMGVEFLGSIPLDPTIGRACDTGIPIDCPGTNDTIGFISTVLKKASLNSRSTENGHS